MFLLLKPCLPGHQSLHLTDEENGCIQGLCFLASEPARHGRSITVSRERRSLRRVPEKSKDSYSVNVLELTLGSS